MDFRTQLTLPAPAFTFSYDNRCLLLGSCFAENMGERMSGLRFPLDLNPFGILYNPASVASALERLLHPEPFTADDLIFRDGQYHSLAHHSRFSAASATDCLEQINKRLHFSSESLRQTDRLIVTFGTAYVYRLKSTGEVVANCHKLPDKLFERSRLSVNEIVALWEALLEKLWAQLPELKVLFTVSPIRHWKEGAHENQLSKATLLLVIEQLRSRYPGQTDYFAAYEILLDELRDYRFYADDMLHPSSLAVDYIWERFKEQFMTRESLPLLKEIEAIEKARHHRPFDPDGEAYQKFLVQTLLKMEQIKEKRTYIYNQFDADSIRSKIKK